MSLPTNPAENLASLIRCPSVTPAEGGALTALEAMLEPMGFSIQRPVFTDEDTPDIENLYARKSGNGAHLMFAGHTDVVPPGNEGDWKHPPFSAAIEDGIMYGRGAVDMKGGIACFVAAVARHIEKQGSLKGSVSFLITGDEEGPAINGTEKLLQWAKDRGETWDASLVGEPTNPDTLGDMIKIGRRGSISGTITVHGVQGHAAYPQQADNPIHRLLRALHSLTATPLDAGTQWFEPSTLQVTSVDVGNAATNVIPATARARLNIRFNDLHTSASLGERIRAALEEAGARHDLDLSCSGESFLTQPGPFAQALLAAIRRVTGVEAALDTGGGTSDARFIARYCPVAELGAVGATMHKADESTPVEELRRLARLYAEVIVSLLRKEPSA